MVVIFDYYSDWDDIYIFTILIEFDEDLKSFSKIINKGYIISYRKENIINGIVENVSYIDESEKKLLIEVIMKNNLIKNFYIKKNESFKLSGLEEYMEKRIFRIINNDSRYRIYKESISNEYISNESFKILKEYMNKKSDKVIYGEEVISNIEKGNIKIVFVNWTFIKRKYDKWFYIFTNKSKKYNNANIVIYDKNNVNYSEIKNYGGIIGVKN